MVFLKVFHFISNDNGKSVILHHQNLLKISNAINKLNIALKNCMLFNKKYVYIYQTLMQVKKFRLFDMPKHLF